MNSYDTHDADLTILSIAETFARHVEGATTGNEHKQTLSLLVADIETGEQLMRLFMQATSMIAMIVVAGSRQHRLDYQAVFNHYRELTLSSEAGFLGALAEMVECNCENCRAWRDENGEGVGA